MGALEHMPNLLLFPLELRPRETAWSPRKFELHPTSNILHPPDQSKKTTTSKKNMEEVKVIGFWTSPYVYRVIWALNLKGIKYEYLEEDIFNKTDLLLRHNPVHKKVPVFVHGGKTIAESMIILEYIDETWPQNPLLPNDPHARAVARFWTKFGDDKKQNFIRFYKSVGEELARAVKDAQEHLRILEEHGLGEKKFFDGNEIGMTDLSFGWIAFWFEVIEETAGVKVLDVDSFPRLHAWIKNFKEVPGIKGNYPDPTELLAYFKRLREKFTKPANS